MLRATASSQIHWKMFVGRSAARQSAQPVYFTLPDGFANSADGSPHAPSNFRRSQQGGEQTPRRPALNDGWPDNKFCKRLEGLNQQSWGLNSCAHKCI